MPGLFTATVIAFRLLDLATRKAGASLRDGRGNVFLTKPPLPLVSAIGSLYRMFVNTATHTA